MNPQLSRQVLGSSSVSSAQGHTPNLWAHFSWWGFGHVCRGCHQEQMLTAAAGTVPSPLHLKPVSLVSVRTSQGLAKRTQGRSQGNYVRFSG